ncbi:hypothetical protein Poli38472_012631 [Pythium oligandrum]|uniref:WRKY19-like zinc finger domain-containing protein n=1 Tax=Pythium oligandrum TaxID=41045 RepID=A0A8K1FFA6_PYTOL|nr:hypothetical protein Poli38472_012631 [Pythium oligandrum]|eukprot:TMW61440.1 hypothetical protein Poli38472_012631 [Pythium oligandrum]
MSDKAALGFILNPVGARESLVTHDIETGCALLSMARSSSPQTLLPSLGSPLSPLRLNMPLEALNNCQPKEKHDEAKKRFVAIRPNASIVPLPSVPVTHDASSTESDGMEDECDHQDEAMVVSRPKSKTKKKKTRLCKEKGCTSLAVSRRSCVRHGGGSRCLVPGCTNGAKLRNRCFQHGGSTICLAEGCTSKSKRYGYCWSHGGGRICSIEDCDKVAAQGGLCWAHGGGNRCRLDGCEKRSYQKHGYYCKRHAFYNTT